MQVIVHQCHKTGGFEVFEECPIVRLRIICYKMGNNGEKIADILSAYWALTV
jgi:hypothetical protein